MDWFLYDSDLRHERVQYFHNEYKNICPYQLLALTLKHCHFNSSKASIM